MNRITQEDIGNMRAVQILLENIKAGVELFVLADLEVLFREIDRLKDGRFTEEEFRNLYLKGLVKKEGVE